MERGGLRAADQTGASGHVVDWRRRRSKPGSAMKLRLVSLACVALALFSAPSRPVAGSALRVAAGLQLRAALDGRFHGRRAAGRRRKLDRLFRHARAIQGAELGCRPA